jgi:hypothetical protein
MCFLHTFENGGMWSLNLVEHRARCVLNRLGVSPVDANHSLTVNALGTHREAVLPGHRSDQGLRQQAWIWLIVLVTHFDGYLPPSMLCRPDLCVS